MSYFGSEFNAGARDGILGMTTASASSSSGVDGFDTFASGIVAPDNTSATAIAYPSSAANLPTGNDQFAQVTLVNNAGTSSGVFVRATRAGTGTNVGIGGYVARHSGSNIALISFAADGVTPTTLGSFTVARVAGDKLRLTAVGSTISVYLNDFTTPVISVTDTTWASGALVGIRAVGASTQPQFDGFYGGDVADISKVGTENTTGSTGGGGTTTPGTTTPGTTVVNQSPADGIPKWKGLVYSPSGRLMLAGKPLHRLHADFFGPAGTYTPPSWLTVTGTAVLTDPATTLSRLELSTAATIGSVAALSLNPAVASASYAAIRLDVEAMNFTAASPDVVWRLGAAGASKAGAGAIQSTADPSVLLYSGSEGNTTRGVFSHLGATAVQRRQTSVLILPGSKHVFLLEDDEVLAWRDGTADWVDGVVTPSLSITANAATAAALRLSSFTVTLYA
jgi:hypothetical protein